MNCVPHSLVTHRNWRLAGWRVLAIVVTATGVSSVALAADEGVYLDEPRPEPPPKVMGKITVPEKYEDGTLRVEREVLRMSDDSMVNDGKFTEYYQGGQKFAEGTFLQGVHNGEWTFWHPNGQVGKTVTFIDGLPDGEWDVFAADGKKLAHKSYKMGQRDGHWIIYHSDGVTPRIEQTFLDGKIHGERTTYHANGKPFQQSHFNHGVLDGLLTEWDSSGRKVAEMTFKDGDRDGQKITWSEGLELSGAITPAEPADGGSGQGSVDAGSAPTDSQ